MNDIDLAELDASVDAEMLLRWEADDLPDVVPPVPAWLAELPDTVEELLAAADGRPVRAGVVDPEPDPVVEGFVWAVPGVERAPRRVLPHKAVRRVAAAVQGLGEVPAWEWLDDATLVETEALLAAAAELRVQLLPRLREVQERQLFTASGFRTARTWLATVAPDADPADLTLAKRLAGLPSLDSALASGVVSVSDGRRVGSSLAKCRTHLDAPDGLVDGLDGEQVVEACVGNVMDLVAQDRFGVDPRRSPEDEELLASLEQRCAQISSSGTSQAERVEAAWVLLAEHVHGRALKAALEELEMALVPSWLERREKAASEKRGLVLRSNDDGTWHLEGTLTLQAGERLATALAAEARRDPANPDDTRRRAEAREHEAQAAGTAPGDAALAWQPQGWEIRDPLDGLSRSAAEDLLPRTRTKRLHDAFDRLLGRYLNHGLGGKRGKVPVQVTVTVPEAAVTGRAGALPGKTAHGRLTARSLLRRWWCDAHVTPLLMSRGWTPLGVAHTARTITGTELKAALVQFGNRCAGEGCCPGTPDPLVPLIPHHVTRYCEQGTTSLQETVLLCEVLHDDLHLGKKTLRLRNGQLLNETGYVTEPGTT